MWLNSILDIVLRDGAIGLQKINFRWRRCTQITYETGVFSNSTNSRVSLHLIFEHSKAYVDAS